jgi:hypothetical protein
MIKIRDRPSHLQDSIVSARRESEPSDGHFQHSLAGIVERA